MSGPEEIVIDATPTITVGDLWRAMKDLPMNTPVTGYLAGVHVYTERALSEYVSLDTYVNMTGVSIHGREEGGPILTLEVEDTWDSRQF